MRIDPDSPTPVYEQVRAQIIAGIEDGSLPVGSRLPTVRRLAADLALAPNTVARTYRHLEAAGVIETRGRHGSFVADPGAAAQTEAERLAADFARQVRAAGLDPAQSLALVARALGLTP